MQLVVVGMMYNAWSNTVWKGQIVEIEVDRSKIPEYENRLSIKVFGKTLGLLPEEERSLPVGGKVFAKLRTDKNRVLAEVEDIPADWKIPFSGDSLDQFSKEFLDQLDTHGWMGGFDVDKFSEVASPSHFYEWLIREGDATKTVDVDTAWSYLSFKEWLDRNEIHDGYDDRALEAYHEYCRSQYEADRLADELDRDYSSYESREARFEEQFGWMEEGEQSVMRAVEGLD